MSIFKNSERILDIGSGFGVDSIIATKAIGEEDGLQCANRANQRTN